MDVIKTYVECSPIPYQPTDVNTIALKQHKVADEIVTLLLKRGARVRAAVAQAQERSFFRRRPGRAKNGRRRLGPGQLRILSALLPAAKSAGFGLRAVGSLVLLSAGLSIWKSRKHGTGPPRTNRARIPVSLRLEGQ
jgi:hypothetical protein